MEGKPEMDLDRLEEQLKDCIKEGYGNARTPIDWFSIGLPLLKVAKQVREIAREAMLPDGDNVNVPTQLWAEALMDDLHVAWPPAPPAAL
jgi:hypothetical protein